MSAGAPLGLFEGFGIEIEYMIVDAVSLQVAPLADVVLLDAAGKIESEVEDGALCWSNELVLHVLELKTNGPSPTLQGLSNVFQGGVSRVEQALAGHGARLLPSAMHPLMDPARETRLWPHDGQEIYRAFDRIFDCRGHGWSNLQSVHLNLPYRDDDEFGRLHAAVRLVLPLLPALAASSPFREAGVTGLLDTRLEHYRSNCKRLPAVTGRVIPEAVFTPADYRRAILEPIACALKPLDPDGVLEAEWVNARGAIARFERQSIEIRVIDTQERPHADLAIVALTVAVLQDLVEREQSERALQRGLSATELEAVFLDALRQGPSALLTHGGLLRAFGFSQSELPLGQVWGRLCERACASGRLPVQFEEPLQHIFRHGTLAERLLAAAGPTPSLDRIRHVYGELADCLRHGAPFAP